MNADNSRDFDRAVKVSSIPDIYYRPDFVNTEEEAALVEYISNSKAAWKEVKGRRVQNYGGVVEQGLLLQSRFPGWLETLVKKVQVESGVFGDKKPNHVLLNAYKPGQGIYSHQDGPIYHPGVCILSLGSSAVMNFRCKLTAGGYESLPSAQIMLQPRSLLTFCSQAYTGCLHGIDEVEQDEMHPGISNLLSTGFESGETVRREEERFSLTIRRVLRSKANLLRL